MDTVAAGTGAGAEAGTNTSAGAGLEARVRELEEEAVAARTALASRALEHEIDLALMTAGVVDLEAGRTLVRGALASQGGNDRAAVRGVVSELRQRKAYLFSRTGGAGTAGATGVARPTAGGSAGVLTHMAEKARASGDRRSLLDYMRLRRAGG